MFHRGSAPYSLYRINHPYHFFFAAQQHDKPTARLLPHALTVQCVPSNEPRRQSILWIWENRMPCCGISDLHWGHLIVKIVKRKSHKGSLGLRRLALLGCAKAKYSSWPEWLAEENQCWILIHRKWQKGGKSIYIPLPRCSYREKNPISKIFKNAIKQLACLNWAACRYPWFHFRSL